MSEKLRKEKSTRKRERRVFDKSDVHIMFRGLDWKSLLFDTINSQIKIRRKLKEHRIV